MTRGGAAFKGTVWQTSLWDDALRGDERLDPVVEYVLHNSVRSGLVERWGEYGRSGSSVFGLADPGGGQAPALQRKLKLKGLPINLWVKT